MFTPRPDAAWVLWFRPRKRCKLARAQRAAARELARMQEIREQIEKGRDYWLARYEEDGWPRCLPCAMCAGPHDEAEHNAAMAVGYADEAWCGRSKPHGPHPGPDLTVPDCPGVRDA